MDLAEQVWESFSRAFWMEDKGYLKDVVSGTAADAQLRCNQIWAVPAPFPLGAYYLAYLKTRGNAPEAARTVREQLGGMEAMLREGCVGQLPEIYDGGVPGASRGCFAQAWSVGELLRVYDALEGRLPEPLTAI